MINVSKKSLANEHVALTHPERAIFLVPGFRDLRILLDPTGTVATFVQDIQKVVWEHLQPEADAYASYHMMLESEFPFKILNALQQENSEAQVYETMNLMNALTEIMAVQRGIFIQSNQTYFQQVQENMGYRSRWTYYHHLTTGIQPLAPTMPTISGQCLAVLYLFIETASELSSILRHDHSVVVNMTVNEIRRVLDDRYLHISIRSLQSE